ncbi:uncharacterized protein clos isoform X2 [Prorops nasuta]|uniref:uncharacterized protein clos isoform X2 n=1 Tax=Prorops nasuta TaxID=863751 RepID=UPI0034CEB756
MAKNYVTNRFFLISLLFFVSFIKNNCSASSHLYNAFQQTTDFFETLKTLDDINEIDRKINEFTQSQLKNIQSRQKREPNEKTKGINVFEDLERAFGYVEYAARKVAFFPLFDSMNNKVNWFAASFNSSHLNLEDLYDNKALVHRLSHSISNGKQIIVNKINEKTLITTINNDGVIKVLRLLPVGNQLQLSQAQHFKVLNIIHANTWIGMKELYLGIATNKNLLIYKWLGEHFDLTKISDLRCTRIMPFENRGFMHIATSGEETKILKHNFRTNNFDTVQRLPGSTDVFTLSLRKNHFSEHFLITSGPTSTIIYKEMDNVFVPFQQIVASKKSVAFTIMKTVLIFLLRNENLIVYQYDGWRFVEVKQIPEVITDIRKIELFGIKSLLIEYNNQIEVRNFVWSRKASWEVMKDELGSWCNDAINKIKPVNILPEVNSSSAPMKSMNRGGPQTNYIHNTSLRKLENLTNSYKEMKSRLERTKISFMNKKTKEPINYTQLNAKIARIRCGDNCIIHKLVTDNQNDIVRQLKKIDNKSQSLVFKNLTLKNLSKVLLPCPVPAIAFKETLINGTINGMNFQYLKENSLKTYGDQIITGQHMYQNISVNNAHLPLGIVTKSVIGKIQASVIRVNELNLPKRQYLFPLNGPPISVTGSISAPKITLKGPTTFNGHLAGKASENIKQFKLIIEPLTLYKNYTLQNVKIENYVEAKDFVRNQGKSVKEIFNNAISLNESNIPVHLVFEQGKVVWNNVTLENHPEWITAHNAEEPVIVISGTKIVPRNISLTQLRTLPIPKLNVKLCMKSAVTSEVNTSTFVVNRLTAENIQATRIHGAKNLYDVLSNFATSVNNIDLSEKEFTGNVVVENATVRKMEDFKAPGLKEFLQKWNPPNEFLGPIELENLTVGDLYAPNGLVIPPPSFIKKLEIKSDATIEYINNIKMEKFLEDVIKIDNHISLKNITFAGGLKATSINAFETSIRLKPLETLNLQSKKIKGILSTSGLHVPDSFEYPSSDSPMDLLINGEIIFSSEPTINNINSINLENLTQEIWMLNDESTKLTGNDLIMKSMTFEGDVIIHGNITPPLKEDWSSLSERILNKEFQVINVPVKFTNVQALNILSRGNVNLKSFAPDINDMLINSLKKNVPEQIINGTLSFNEVHIIGDLNLKGKLNNLYLTTDIVRYDMDQNIVTGKKIVNNLKAKRLNGLKFDEFKKKAALKNKDSLIIKGQKIFKNVIINNLRVDGKIMGTNVKKILLKTGKQEIRGLKIIKGDISAPRVITNCLINDVNVTDLINHRLKKNEIEQTIKTEFILNGTLEIFGNATFNGLYNGIPLTKLNTIFKKVNPIETKLSELRKVANYINLALQNHAIYMDKLVPVDYKTNLLFAKIRDDGNKLMFNEFGMCEITNMSLYCNGTRLIYFNISMQPENFIKLKLVDLRGHPILVFVGSETISTYSFNNNTTKFEQLTELRIPGLMEAAIESTNISLWVALRLSHQTIVLRYDLSIGYQKYILPKVQSIIMSKVPNNQLLLVTSYGIWNLEGLGFPRQIFKINLPGQIETLTFNGNYFVKATNGNETSLFKAKYINVN